MCLHSTEATSSISRPSHNSSPRAAYLIPELPSGVRHVLHVPEQFALAENAVLDYRERARSPDQHGYTGQPLDLCDSNLCSNMQPISHW